MDSLVNDAYTVLGVRGTPRINERLFCCSCAVMRPTDTHIYVRCTRAVREPGTLPWTALDNPVFRRA